MRLAWLQRCILIAGCLALALPAFAFHPAPGEWEVRVALNGAADKPKRECFKGDEVDKFMNSNERGMFRHCKRSNLKRGATELSASYDCERGTGEMKYSLINTDRLQGEIVMRETLARTATAPKGDARITTISMSAKRVAAACSKRTDDDDDAD